jgi:thiamine-monophosphate kinase
MSVGISNRFSLEAIDEFYEGVYAACEKYGVDLIGGDTASSQKGFIISVTAIGEVTPDKFVKKKYSAKRGPALRKRRSRRGLYWFAFSGEREKDLHGKSFYPT